MRLAGRVTTLLPEVHMNTEGIVAMTEDEFFNLLPRTKKAFQWKIKNGSLHGVHNGHKCCPVTALASVAFGTMYRFTQPQLAAEHLGLDTELANNLGLAAGSPNPNYTELRAKLVRTLLS